MTDEITRLTAENQDLKDLAKRREWGAKEMDRLRTENAALERELESWRGGDYVSAYEHERELAEARRRVDEYRTRKEELIDENAALLELLTNNVPHLMTVKLPEHTMPEDLAPEEDHNLAVIQLRAAIDAGKGE